MGFVEIPVVENFNSNEFTLVEQDEPEYYLQEKTLQNSLNIPEEEKKLLPRDGKSLVI